MNEKNQGGEPTGHGSVYDRLLTLLHDRDDAIAGDAPDANELDASVQEILRITSPSEQPEPVAWHERAIAEQIDEGAGFWKACSGCQEGVDGYVSTKDYPYSKVFRCQPGGGCSECGGLGVLWDDIDYDDMARSILAEDAQPSKQTGGGGRLTDEEHAVIARCVERQPKIYMRGQHEGYYVHSDVADLIDTIGRLAALSTNEVGKSREGPIKMRNHLDTGHRYD